MAMSPEKKAWLIARRRKARQKEHERDRMQSILFVILSEAKALKRPDSSIRSE
jgi:hypothetical protein